LTDVLERFREAAEEDRCSYATYSNIISFEVDDGTTIRYEKKSSGYFIGPEGRNVIVLVFSYSYAVLVYVVLVNTADEPVILNVSRFGDLEVIESFS